MQTVIFKLANVNRFAKAIIHYNETVKTTNGSNGEKINKKHKAIDKAVDGLKKIAHPAEWANAELEEVVKTDVPKFVTDVLLPQLAMQGTTCRSRSLLPTASSSRARRITRGAGLRRSSRSGTARSARCATSARCTARAGAIQPFQLNEEEAAKAPESFTTINTRGAGEVAKSKFRVQVSTMDFTGCTTACPTNCLTMKDIAEVHEVQTKNQDYAMTLPARTDSTRSPKQK